MTATRRTAARQLRTGRRAPGTLVTPEAAVVDSIEQRVLWLAVRMIHEANLVRPNPDGLKVGGHQASSASMVSILSALYLRWLRPDDLVAIKPHSSPVYHSLRYLMGDLDGQWLTTLRAVRRPPVVPVAHQGPRPDRLLDRLGRARRRRADVRGARRPVPACPHPGRGDPLAGPPVRGHGRATPSWTRATSGRRCWRTRSRALAT